MVASGGMMHMQMNEKVRENRLRHTPIGGDTVW
jgi:hypothetical protein